MKYVLKLTKVHAEGISICEVARREMMELQRREPTSRVLHDQVQADGADRLGGGYSAGEYFACASIKSVQGRSVDIDSRTSSNLIRPKLCRIQPDPLEVL